MKDDIVTKAISRIISYWIQPSKKSSWTVDSNCRWTNCVFCVAGKDWKFCWLACDWVVLCTKAWEVTISKNCFRSLRDWICLYRISGPPFVLYIDVLILGNLFFNRLLIFKRYGTNWSLCFRFNASAVLINDHLYLDENFFVNNDFN